MNKVAIVTGASGGIGSEICQEFMKQGWDVIGTDITKSPLDLFHFEYSNFSEANAVEALFENLKDFPRIDTIINNAAICINKPISETTDKDWEDTFNINVKSAFKMTRLFRDLLERSKGSIVNISSVHSISTSKNISAYAASKGALTSLTRAIALEYAPLQIRCNAVLPGAIDTSMLRNGLSRDGSSHTTNESLQKLQSSIPLGFIGLAKHIAPTVVHLADAKYSPYTTGQVITVDGGALAQLSTE
tara:strand:- start:1989 stop:2726 length:738 start_codon:yes stop_codon:yes gene_type:complete